MTKINFNLTFWSTLVALVISVAGATNSVFGFFKSNFFAHHSLLIDVEGVHAVGNIANYVIVFHNNGNYTDVVTNASSILLQPVKTGNKIGYLHWGMRYCFKPLLIQPGEQKVIVYPTLYNTQKKGMHAFNSQYNLFFPSINFSVSGHNGIVQKMVKLGVIENNSFNFRTLKTSINFKNSRPEIVIGSLPESPKYADLSLCQKIRN
ncbi:MAG: hypothetical protein M1488_08870 [Gammaproteobacteria bacterium]|nr:hypothetical protein [Gammaproteobacteria bacterium]